MGRVCRLMQVHMCEHLCTEFLNVLEHIAGLFDGSVLIEGSVGVDGVGVPSVDGLVAPWADTRHYDDVERLCVLVHHCVNEFECSVDSTRLIAMHASCHQNSLP